MLKLRDLSPLLVAIIPLGFLLAGCCEDGSEPPCKTIHYRVTMYDDSGGIIDEWIVPHTSIWDSDGGMEWVDRDLNQRVHVIGNVTAVPFEAEIEEESNDGSQQGS